MKILFLYASTEGQTAEIARQGMNTLTDLGHSVALVHARDGYDLDFSSFGAVVVAGSVHAGSYQEELVKTVKAHVFALRERPNHFLSVSLAAAGTDDDDWNGLENCVQKFTADTGWTPDRTEHVAGAFKFSEYGFFRYWAMRWIRSKNDR